MTSFESYSTMAPQLASDFSLYASTQEEQFPDFVATTQPGLMANPAFFDPSPYGPALSLDAHASMNAFHGMQTHPHGFPSPANSASHSFDVAPPHLSTASESGASVQSTSSSAMGSPSLNAQYQQQESWTNLDNGLGLAPGFNTSGLGYDPIVAPNDKLTVDPNLIHPFGSPNAFTTGSPYPDFPAPSPMPFVEHPPSPTPSQGSPHHRGSNQFKAGSTSPYLHNRGFHPYPQPGFNGSRRPSASSIHSIHSKSSRRSGSFELDDETREKGLCPIPDCGRVFKDLKAHMLTHQNERPEKCPIITCEYHQKGFARKYDKNRHTLTHYKGNMVCGFCPGSGSAAEKSFNRADVFKRHLTSVHGVEQTPPNSRKKSPQTAKKGTYAAGAAQPSHSTGTCSTCGVTFASAQDFYEHLDDCVLRVVQQTEPSEAINQKLLASVAADDNVKETMEMHCLPSAVDGGFGSAAPAAYDEEDEDDADADADADADDADDDVNAAAAAPSARAARSGKGAIRSRRDASC